MNERVFIKCLLPSDIFSNLVQSNANEVFLFGSLVQKNLYSSDEADLIGKNLSTYEILIEKYDFKSNSGSKIPLGILVKKSFIHSHDHRRLFKNSQNDFKFIITFDDSKENELQFELNSNKDKSKDTRVLFLLYDIAHIGENSIIQSFENKNFTSEEDTFQRELKK